MEDVQVHNMEILQVAHHIWHHTGGCGASVGYLHLQCSSKCACIPLPTGTRVPLLGAGYQHQCTYLPPLAVYSHHTMWVLICPVFSRFTEHLGESIGGENIAILRIWVLRSFLICSLA